MSEQGTWVWSADHDLDAKSSPQISVFTGRGILSESAGPVWFIGTGKSTVLFLLPDHDKLWQQLVSLVKFLCLLDTEAVTHHVSGARDSVPV